MVEVNKQRLFLTLPGAFVFFVLAMASRSATKFVISARLSAQQQNAKHKLNATSGVLFSTFLKNLNIMFQILVQQWLLITMKAVQRLSEY